MLAYLHTDQVRNRHTFLCSLQQLMSCTHPNLRALSWNVSKLLNSLITQTSQAQDSNALSLTFHTIFYHWSLQQNRSDLIENKQTNITQANKQNNNKNHINKLNQPTHTPHSQGKKDTTKVKGLNIVCRVLCVLFIDKCSGKEVFEETSVK